MNITEHEQLYLATYDAIKNARDNDINLEKEMQNSQLLRAENEELLEEKTQTEVEQEYLKN